MVRRGVQFADVRLTVTDSERFFLGDHVTLSGGRACFYRLDEKKKYCMKKMENDKQYGDWVVFPYGHSEYEGKWFLYQKQNSSPLILRDMDCYCEAG